MPGDGWKFSNAAINTLFRDTRARTATFSKRSRSYCRDQVLSTWKKKTLIDWCCFYYSNATDIDKFKITSLLFHITFTFHIRVMLAEAKKKQLRPQRTVACTTQPSLPHSTPATEQGASRPPGDSEVHKKEAKEASPAGNSEAGEEPGFLQRQLDQIQQLEEAVPRETHAVASRANYVDAHTGIVEGSGNSHPPTPLSDEGDSSVLLDVVKKLRQNQKAIIVGEWH